MTKSLDERAHSKLPASGAERWTECTAAVELEEISPESKDTVWSLEGTQAHDLFDAQIKAFLYPGNELGEVTNFRRLHKQAPLEMQLAVDKCFKKVVEIKWKCDGELFSEERIWNTNIHPEMFGTGDVQIVKLGQVLHVIDLKYGKGHVVSAERNKQLIQYALGLCHKYNWNFKVVVVHIMQPRAGKNWHKEWTIPIWKLKNEWLPYFQSKVDEAISSWSEPNPGNWCYWCRANQVGEDGQVVCPAKRQVREEKVTSVFERNPLKGSYEKRKSETVAAQKSESANLERKTKTVNFGKIG